MQADREEVFQVTIPAGTAEAEPFTENVSFNQGVVVGFELVIPYGCAGFSGVRLVASDGQIWPSKRGTWVIGDDDIIRREPLNWPNSGRFEFQGYNTGKYDHTYELRFSIIEIPVAPIKETTATPLPTTPTGEITGGAGENPTTETPITEKEGPPETIQPEQPGSTLPESEQTPVSETPTEPLPPEAPPTAEPEPPPIAEFGPEPLPEGPEPGPVPLEAFGPEPLPEPGGEGSEPPVVISQTAQKQTSGTKRKTTTKKPVKKPARKTTTKKPAKKPAKRKATTKKPAAHKAKPAPKRKTTPAHKPAAKKTPAPKRKATPKPAAKPKSKPAPKRAPAPKPKPAPKRQAPPPPPKHHK